MHARASCGRFEFASRWATMPVLLEQRLLCSMPTLEDFIKPKDVALRLPLSFDPDRLGADLDRMEPDWWHGHLGPYHDGNWQAIALWAPDGDRASQISKGGPFAATEALKRCAYVGEVLERFPGRKSRVRFLKLRAGGQIFLHSD